MKNIQRILALIIIGFAFIACTNQTKEDNTISLWVNSQTVDCVGVGSMKCMQIQESDSIQEGQWQNFYSKIEGFEYKEGFVYHLKVKKEELDPKTIPADASSIKYTLIEQLSKTETPTRMNGKWTLISINGKALAITDEAKIPEIKINITKMKLNGFSGCNRITMGIELTANKGLKFKQGIMTRMACPEPNYEKDFMQAMNAVASYELSDEKLVFYNSDGVEVLSFQPLRGA